MAAHTLKYLKSAQAPLMDRLTAHKPEGLADYGRALRSIYQKAVDEDVPDEFLALLEQLR